MAFISGDMQQIRNGVLQEKKFTCIYYYIIAYGSLSANILHIKRSYEPLYEPIVDHKKSSELSCVHINIKLNPPLRMMLPKIFN